jgi:hypothetical protein
MGIRSTNNGVTPMGHRCIQFDFMIEGVRYRPTLPWNPRGKRRTDPPTAYGASPLALHAQAPRDPVPQAVRRSSFLGELGSHDRTQSALGRKTARAQPADDAAGLRRLAGGDVGVAGHRDPQGDGAVRSARTRGPDERKRATHAGGSGDGRLASELATDADRNTRKCRFQKGKDWRSGRDSKYQQLTDSEETRIPCNPLEPP